MRNLLLVLGPIIDLEAAALACSCVASGSPEESRAEARQLAGTAMAAAWLAPRL